MNSYPRARIADEYPQSVGATPLAPTIPNNSGERGRHGVGRTKAVGGGLARPPLLSRALRRTRGPTETLPLCLLHLERSAATTTTWCITALCLLRLDCRSCSRQRLPARLVTTPQTVHSFIGKKDGRWRLPPTIRLRCYSSGTEASLPVTLTRR